MMPLPFIAPGAKLGLANIISLTVLVLYGYKDSLKILVVRCLLFMIIVGSPISFIYSIVSGIASLTVMLIVYKFLNKYFSLIGVSLFGALTHNFSQVLIASIMVNNFDIFIYLPVLSLISLFTGCFIGISSYYVSDKLLKYKIYIK